jgi:hypothetical protein
MPTFDGIKLMVQFYDNFGQLNKVAKKAKVSERLLRRWLDNDIILPAEKYERLCAAADVMMHDVEVS